jgi:hypothetical protein
MTSVKLDEELLDGVEQFIADRNEPPNGKMSYDDAVNVIVKDWLMAQGYVPVPGKGAEITPDSKPGLTSGEIETLARFRDATLPLDIDPLHFAKLLSLALVEQKEGGPVLTPAGKVRLSQNDR